MTVLWGANRTSNKKTTPRLAICHHSTCKKVLESCLIALSETTSVWNHVNSHLSDHHRKAVRLSQQTNTTNASNQTRTTKTAIIILKTLRMPAQASLEKWLRNKAPTPNQIITTNQAIKQTDDHLSSKAAPIDLLAVTKGSVRIKEQTQRKYHNCVKELQTLKLITNLIKTTKYTPVLASQTKEIIRSQFIRSKEVAWNTSLTPLMQSSSMQALLRRNWLQQSLLRHSLLQQNWLQQNFRKDVLLKLNIWRNTDSKQKHPRVKSLQMLAISRTRPSQTKWPS